MNVQPLLSTFVVVAGGIDEGQGSPNNGAGVAGFVLLLLWIIIFVVQVLRRRRRRAGMGGDGAVHDSTSSPGSDRDPRPRDTP